MSRPRRQASRRHTAALCLCAALALAGVSAPPAISASLGANPALSELAGQTTTPTQTTATQTTATTESGSNSKSATVVIIALAAAGALIVGILFVIFRDARSVVPAGDASIGEGTSPRHSPERLRRRRAKAKAARQQRKRNR